MVTQKQVREPMARYGLSLDPQIRMLDVASEVGELAKEVLKANGYGTKPLEKHAALEEELGDCLFSLLCLCESLGLEGETALDKALNKYEKRFAENGEIGHLVEGVPLPEECGT